jgi:hypothetical protein
LGRFFFMMERRAKATFEPMAILSVEKGCRGKKRKERVTVMSSTIFTQILSKKNSDLLGVNDIVVAEEEHFKVTHFAAMVPSSLLIVTTSSCPRVEAYATP